MKFPDTPSLAAFKSDAAFLLRDFRTGCPDAMRRVAQALPIHSHTVTHSTCLQVLAREYGMTYQRIAAEERMISRYAHHCFAEGFWRQPYLGSFRRARFLLQFDALIECMRDQIPLAVTAEKRGVDFHGFHFSALLFRRIGRVLERKRVPDFSHLQATGSLVHYDWLNDVTSLSHSNFRDAKFYVVTADPVVQPGAKCWRADFSHANLDGVDLRGAYLRRARFIGAKMNGADMRNANINECIFTRARGVFVSGEILYHNWDVGPHGIVPWEPEDDA